MMKTVLLPALPVCLLLAACDAMPTQPAATPTPAPAFSAAAAVPAQRFVDESLYDMTDSMISITCEDGTGSELVRLEGGIYEKITLVQNPAGGYLFTLHTMPVGLRGIGVNSGEDYHVNERAQISSSQSPMGLAGSYRQTVRFFSRTARERFSMLVHGHYTINANGELIVERETVRYECAS